MNSELVHAFLPLHTVGCRIYCCQRISSNQREASVHEPSGIESNLSPSGRGTMSVSGYTLHSDNYNIPFTSKLRTFWKVSKSFLLLVTTSKVTSWLKLALKLEGGTTECMREIRGLWRTWVQVLAHIWAGGLNDWSVNQGCSLHLHLHTSTDLHTSANTHKHLCSDSPSLWKLSQIKFLF